MLAFALKITGRTKLLDFRKEESVVYKIHQGDRNKKDEILVEVYCGETMMDLYWENNLSSPMLTSFEFPYFEFGNGFIELRQSCKDATLLMQVLKDGAPDEDAQLVGGMYVIADPKKEYALEEGKNNGRQLETKEKSAGHRFNLVFN